MHFIIYWLLMRLEAVIPPEFYNMRLHHVRFRSSAYIWYYFISILWYELSLFCHLSRVLHVIITLYIVVLIRSFRRFRWLFLLHEEHFIIWGQKVEILSLNIFLPSHNNNKVKIWCWYFYFAFCFLLRRLADGIVSIYQRSIFIIM